MIRPAELVARTRQYGCQGTAISFHEPTLSLEWSLEAFPLAHEAGLCNAVVTNGYMTEAALALLVEAGLDGMNVDVEGDAAAVKTHCQADGEIVWRNCRLARERGVWIELTTLVIPGVNDAAETLQGIAERTVAKLGRDTPWHASRDYPARCYAAPPTAVATLARARQIGRPAGLRYVYPGNVAGHPAEQTTCPDCGMMLVERSSLSLLRCDVTTQGRCPHCGVEIAGVGWRSADGLAN